MAIARLTAMAQRAALDVYGYIEQWWGDQFTTDLARRIATAPWRQLRRFADDWPDLTSLYRSGHLTPLRPGQLRPTFGRLGADSELTVSSQLLLYIDEQVVDAYFLEPLRPIATNARGDTKDTREAIEELLIWLAQVQPLVEDGSLQFSGKGRGRHPSLQGLVTRGVEGSFVDDWTESELGAQSADEITRAVYQLAMALSGNLVAAFERGATPLALTRSEAFTTGVRLRESPLMTIA